MSRDQEDPFDWREVAAPFRVSQTTEHYRRLLQGDPQRAAEWVLGRATGGDHRAQVTWGHMLLNGQGVAPDAEAARRWFEMAARAGDIEGANMAGRCHELGLGTAPNLIQAGHWFRIAADGGDTWACFNLACVILKCDGVAGIREALSLLVRAARRGNPKAMNMIGRALEEGWRGKIKLAAAGRWYLRAARGGCFRGQFHTGRLLLAEAKIEAAAEWFSQSIDTAPADFCQDIAQILACHGDRRICQLGEAARLKGQLSNKATADAAAGEAWKAALPSAPEHRSNRDTPSMPHRRRLVWRDVLPRPKAR